LVRRRGAECGIEGNIGGVVAGRARLDVAAAFALGVRARAPPATLTGHLVYWVIELAWNE
jgi:hypothetical protein